MATNKNTKSKMQRETVALSEVIAEHVDDLQRLGHSWADELDELLDQQRDSTVVMTGKFVRQLVNDSNGVVNISARKKLIALKKKIATLRKPFYRTMNMFIESQIEEVVKNEAGFNEDFIAALLVWMAVNRARLAGKTVDVVEEQKKAYSRIGGIRTSTEARKILKYGIYDGETIKGILEKIVEQDIDRTTTAIINEILQYNALNEMQLQDLENSKQYTELIRKREDDAIRKVTDAIDRATNKAKTQMRINITMILNGISNDVATIIADENNALIDGVMWLTALDERVCEECDELEGKIFNPEDAPSCPLHPNCRCHLIPITKEIEKEISSLQSEEGEE